MKKNALLAMTKTPAPVLPKAKPVKVKPIVPVAPTKPPVMDPKDATKYKRKK